jgi:hypothetical protein
MTRLRCSHLTITAPWFNARPPINWGMPANQFWPTLYAYPGETIYLDPPEWRRFTPTGGKRP